MNKSNMTSAKIETITLTLTAAEAYSLCNKITDNALVTHGGYCEFEQIELLQKIGRDLGRLVDHPSANNNLMLDVAHAVYTANASDDRHLPGSSAHPKNQTPTG